MMEHKELTEKIIGCAFQVYNNMGFGFSTRGGSLIRICL